MSVTSRSHIKGRQEKMKITDKELDTLVEFVEVTSDTKKTVDVFKLYNTIRTMNGHTVITVEEFKARELQDNPMLQLIKEL